MSEKAAPYSIVELPPARRFMANLLDMGGPKHFMYGLLEVDVTVARQHIAQHKLFTGESLSFTGYLISCLARALDEDKAVQAYRKGRKQLVLFDDVDVALMVERQVGGQRRPTGHVIRAANHKTYREIHQEIRTVQSTPVSPPRGPAAWCYSALLLPWPVPKLLSALYRLVTRRDPTMGVSLNGTVLVTAVGMFGEGQGGWGVYPIPFSLGVVVGSTTWKPAVVEGRIEPREILNLTLVFDHDIVDGAPAARFTRRLVELVESGYGLYADEPRTAPDVEAMAATSEPIFISNRSGCDPIGRG